MRKIIVLEFITLDGVMQAPGGPEEDTSGGFEFGGWCAPYNDEVSGKIMKQQMQASDLLLGRKTFEIFETYWPEHADFWPGINVVNKYVMSNSRKKSEWHNSHFINSLAEIEALKISEGSDLKVWGSGELTQFLLENDLVDKMWLKIYPLTLGYGKKLFGGGKVPRAFTLFESTISAKGIIFANYRREGVVKTGRVGT